jgi:transposase
MKNKYCKRSHISEAQFRSVLRCFSQDFDSYSTAEILGISRRSIQKYFEKLRTRISTWVSDEKPFSGEVEVDESL